MTFDIRLKQAGYFFFNVLVLTVCISKAAVNITESLLIMVTAIYLAFYYRRIDLKKHNYVLILLFPFLVGFVSSFFSLSGVKAVLPFLERSRFFFLVLSFALIIDSERKINTLLVLLNVSALVSIVYGLFNIDWEIDVWGQIIGFHTLGRSSDLMMSIILMNITALLIWHWQDIKSNFIFKTMIGIHTLFMVSGVLAMGRRASILGLIFGMTVMLVVKRRFLLLFFGFAVITCSLFVGNNWIVSRLKSLSDMTNNESNEIRLQVLITGVDFIMDKNLYLRGVGEKKPEKLFADYYNSKPETYRKKYPKVVEAFGNFHNSFLQMAIEFGVLFAAIFLMCISIILFRLLAGITKLEGNKCFYPIAAIAVTSGFFLTQFFHGDLYMYGGIPFIIILSAGCFVCLARINEDQNPFDKLADPTIVLYGPNGPELHKA